MTMLRIAHISDLHFSKITFNPLQFFSKRWIGNCNLIFSRSKAFKKSQILKLPHLLQKKKIDLVIVSGDFSTTGQDKEFLEAKSLLDEFTAKGMKVLGIPGNHDHYTKKDYRNKKFYRYLSNESEGPFNLQEHKVEIGPLMNGWWYVLLDSVVATPLYSSEGLFTEEAEKNLKKALKKIPKDEKIILINHFPFFRYDHPRKSLKRAKDLQKVIENHPQVQIYLHGHTHRHTIADLRASSLPIILDSGCIAHKERGSFNLLELQENQLDLAVYNVRKNEWEKNKTVQFSW